MSMMADDASRINTEAGVLADELTKSNGTLRETVARRDRTIREHTAEYRKLVAERDELRVLLDRFAVIRPDDRKVPAWLVPKKKRKAHRATPVLTLSDLHLDEVVDLYEMDGMNEYNRDIATVRFERVVNGFVDVVKHYTTGVHHDGLLLPILGDVLTGEIHDELARTNEAPPMASTVHWIPKLASGIRYLADEFGRVHIPCVDGNHDRTYNRTPKKKRAESSYTWVIYNWLADQFRDDPRVTFALTTSPEQLVQVYNTTILLSHGDGFRSHGGIGGIYPSMLKWLLRKHQMYTTTKRDFRLALIGHWHQSIWHYDCFVNNSLKGYDEYAKDNGFGYSPPSQQMFMVTPEHGPGHRDEIFA